MFGADVSTVIEMTFVVIILAWVLTRSKDFGDVVGSVGKVYTSSAGVLMPKQSPF